MITFKKKVLKVVSEIREGEMLTYKKITKRAGRSGAYRAVGNILNKNYDSNISCHRVIKSDGDFGEFVDSCSHPLVCFANPDDAKNQWRFSLLFAALRGYCFD